jgi:hypothetical protein
VKKLGRHKVFDVVLDEETQYTSLVVPHTILIDDEAKLALARSLDAPPDRDSKPGRFQSMPTELSWMILENLDFKSCVNLATTCSKMRQIIYGSPSFRLLKMHCAPILVALSRTKLLGLHTISRLHDSLRSPECTTCRKFGPFMFLPYAERCCFTCIIEHRRYRVVPLKQAKRFFEFPDEYFDNVPIMTNIPGAYYIVNPYKCPKLMQYVPVPAVDRLAKEKYGQEDAVRKFIDRQLRITTSKTFSDECKEWVQLYYDMYLPISEWMAIVDNDPDRLSMDLFAGISIIKFPYLNDQREIEQGFYCAACQMIWADFQMHTYAGRHPQLEDEAQNNLCDKLNTAAQTAYSKEGFMEHVGVCPEAQNSADEMGLDIAEIVKYYKENPPASPDLTLQLSIPDDEWETDEDSDDVWESEDE